MKKSTASHRSIRSKLLVPLLTVAGIMVVLGLVIQVVEKHNDREQSLERNASILVRTTAMGLSNPVWTYNFDGIGRMAKSLFLDPDVRSIRVADADGKPLFEKSAADQLSTHPLSVEIPIQEGSVVIGHLAVAWTRNRIRQELLADVLEAAVLVLALLAVLSATIVGVVSRVLRPLKALVSLIDDFTIGQPPRQDVAFANDEVGYVFGRFQQMASSLFDKNVAVHQLAYRDGLTGLPNRAAIYMELTRLLTSDGSAVPARFSLHLIDIDDFKLTNDAFGYRVGDNLLTQMAARLQTIKESHGVQVGRLGDDEFVVIRKDSRLRRSDFGPLLASALSGAYVFDGLKHNLAVSVGMARYPDHGETIEDLMRNADTALLSVKAQGKGAALEFSPEMGDKLRRATHLERHLRSALENHETWVAFQPQYDFATAGVRSFEALLRWENAEFGMISPADFIPLAEKSGLIVPLGEWVLDQAYQFLGELEAHGQPGLQIAVNVSPVQILDDGFLDRIQALVIAGGRDPRSIILEITESTFIQNLKEVQPRLRTLREWGFGLSLDDFGTGYSSLSYLRELPFEELKIDKSFLDSLDQDQAAKGMLRALIALANELNLNVVAEGVESAQQWEFVRACGCHKIQGYFLSRPLRADRALEFLSSPAVIPPGVVV